MPVENTPAASHAGQLSLTGLVLDASPLAQAVLGLLLLASLLSWWLIFLLRSRLRAAERQGQAFENRFWSGGNLAELYQAHRREMADDPPNLGMFRVAYGEYARWQPAVGRAEATTDEALAAVARVLRVTHVREMERLERGQAWLATIGSVSPYIGLFGTVWGIMASFVAIGAQKQASLAQVAPGIAEALIATAAGLFAAIPAVVAYNAFTDRLDRLANRYGTFGDELTGIIERGLKANVPMRASVPGSHPAAPSANPGSSHMAAALPVSLSTGPVA